MGRPRTTYYVVGDTASGIAMTKKPVINPVVLRDRFPRCRLNRDLSSLPTPPQKKPRDMQSRHPALMPVMRTVANMWLQEVTDEIGRSGAAGQRVGLANSTRRCDVLIRANSRVWFTRNHSFLSLISRWINLPTPPLSVVFFFFFLRDCLFMLRSALCHQVTSL